MGAKPLVTSDEVISSRPPRFIRIVFGITIGVIVFLLLGVGSAFGYEQWLNGRTMHRITYAGESVELLDASALKAIIEQANARLASIQVEIVYKGERLQLPLSDFSPEFDSDATVSKILATRMTIENQPWETFMPMVETLWQGRDFQPSFMLNQVPKPVTDLVASAVETGRDAHFQLNSDGSLSIVDEELGTALDAANLLSSVEQNVATGQVTQVTLMSVSPQTTSAVLASALPAMKTVVSSPLTLEANGKKFGVSPADLLQAVQLTEHNADWTVELQVEKLAARFDEIAKSVEKVAKPRQINAANGDIMAEGTDGLAIDRAATTIAMAAALTNRLSANAATSAVTIVTKVVAPTDQKIQPNNTPGMFPGKYIEVDLSSQRLYQYEGEMLVSEFRVSTGKWSTPTPVGTYAITNKSERAYSKPYDLYMPYWMGFIGTKYGIHELPEWPDGRKEGESHIGTPVSHGCIRLGVGDAKTLYEWAEVGTPVVVHK